ncbi:hypothetical protein J6590_093876 [Homalodisca vitripennis]|nr:hypothetical protein J6590_093876 [Homalodisca vitripennis]
MQLERRSARPKASSQLLPSKPCRRHKRTPGSRLNWLYLGGEPALRVIQTGLQEQERSRCRPRNHALLPFRVEKR